MDKNEILKYRRENEKWLCPECDTENVMSDSNCIICGCNRTAYSVILKKWTEEVKEEREVVGNIPKDEEHEEYILEEKIKRKNRWLIAIIVFVILAIIGSLEDTQAAYETSLNNTDNYETQVLNQTEDELFTISDLIN